MSLDRVSLCGLRVRGRHGVYEHERRDGQDFVVDAVLGLDTRAAAAADDLSRTVDYGALAQRLTAVVAVNPVRLIETLAGGGTGMPGRARRPGGGNHCPQAAGTTVPGVR